MKRYLAVLLLSVGLLSVNCTTSGSDNDGLPVIDVVGNLGTYRQIPMSELISEVEYIRLEIGPESMAGRKDHIIVTDTRIFIGGYKECHVFTREGKFISDVGRVGRGPGEWRSFRNMSIDKYNEYVYLETYDKVFEYTLEGRFVRDFEKPVVSIDTSDNNSPLFIEDISFFGDGMFLGHVNNPLGNEPFSWAVFDDSGEIFKKFDNHIKLSREPFWGRVFDTSTMLSESIWAKEGINDTLFSMNSRYELIRKFVFNLGQYAYPLDKHITFDNNYNLTTESVTVDSNPLIVTRDNIFFQLSVGMKTGIHTPVGRKVILPIGTEFNDGQTVVGLYNITNGETILLDRDPVTRKGGLINDLDGGLSFWPQYYNHSENELVQVLEAYEMKELLTEEYFAAHPAKDPEAHARLRALVENLKETDNPVIVVAKLKK